MADRLEALRISRCLFGIVHGDCEEDANYLAELVRREFGYEDIIIQPVGPSIGAHSGPGAIGLCFSANPQVTARHSLAFRKAWTKYPAAWIATGPDGWHTCTGYWTGRILMDHTQVRDLLIAAGVDYDIRHFAE